jgi:hypothetical protein
MADNTTDPFADEDRDALFLVRRHRIEHDDFDGREGNPTNITMEIDQATAVKGAIRIVNETAVNEVHLSRDDGWSVTIRRGALWVYGSGYIISKRGSKFRDGKTFDDLKSSTGFSQNDWCYHLVNIRHAMDFMAHKYITYQKAAISAVFEKQTAFEFHTHALPPEVPDWVDAELYGGFEGFMAIFGEKGSQLEPPCTGE